MLSQDRNSPVEENLVPTGPASEGGAQVELLERVPGEIHWILQWLQPQLDCDVGVGYWALALYTQNTHEPRFLNTENTCGKGPRLFNFKQRPNTLIFLFFWGGGVRIDRDMHADCERRRFHNHWDCWTRHDKGSNAHCAQILVFAENRWPDVVAVHDDFFPRSSTRVQ